MDDDELIASLAGADDMALRQLFDRHAPWLAARLSGESRRCCAMIVLFATRPQRGLP